MPRFALIKDGVVVNICLADSLESAEMVTGFQCVETDTGNIGNQYSNGEFIDIAEPIVQEPMDFETAEELNKMLNDLPLTEEEQLKFDNFKEEQGLE